MTSKVFNEDCKETMAKYPTKHFQLSIVDPPFFSGPDKRKHYGNEVNKLNIRRKDYPVMEHWSLPDMEWYKELCRISKHQIIWGINYFPDFMADAGSGRIIWDKCNGSSSFSDAEIASCSMIKSTRIYRYMWNGMQQGKSVLEGHIMQGNKKLNETRYHPTQKPVALYAWLLSEFAKPGDHIFDSHVGSGSSRIAAYEYGYDFTGAELDEKMFDIQEKRFKEYIISHPNMFKNEHII